MARDQGGTTRTDVSGSDAASGSTGAGAESSGTGTAPSDGSPSRSEESAVPGTAQQTGSQDGQPAAPIDLEKVRPNEDGSVMVVMFHNFVQEYKSGDKEFTTTYSRFEELLQTLYDKGYRLVGLNDFLRNEISVPAGFMPMVFTFDDGTEGQFRLTDSGGRLVADPQSAVGIMEAFNRKHPDFGLKGTFYVNLGNESTFGLKGTLQERLQYLISDGFEIGNHTLDHVNLKEITTADKIQEEIGGNQKRMLELIPGYILKTFSLPYGNPSESLRGYVARGEYQGVSYDNQAIMQVGAEPAPSPVSKRFAPLKLPRVRATGLVNVDYDLDFWLAKVTRASQYVSDGDPATITVPEDRAEDVDSGKLNGKTLRTY